MGVVMRIRMKADMTGTFHGRDGGVARGELVDWLDDASAQNLVDNGLAELVQGVEESAVLDEPDRAEAATVKRRGRPRKRQPDWTDDKAPGWHNAEPDN